MPTNSEANRLNLEYFKKAAKALLKAALAGDADALERIGRFSNRADEPPALHQAQLTIAREQGFTSWPRLRAFAVEAALDAQELAAEFVKTALGDLRRAEEMLERHPHVAHADFYTALVLGDVPQVEQVLSKHAEKATAAGGPKNWAPLLYVCFSRFASPRSGLGDRLAATARLLLNHGADANGFYIDERYPEWPLPCLYGATGLNNNAELARVLLDAGARPVDSESLYHSTEHADLSCVRLLLERGASAKATNVLHHMLDYERIEGVRLLLAAGADPNHLNQRGGTALHWAVWRGRSPEIIAALLAAGASPDIRRKDGRTAYALAVRSGQAETATLLERAGASTDIPPLDRFVGACAAADPGQLKEIIKGAGELPLPEEYARLLPEFSSSHCVPAVRALLAAGVPIDIEGDEGTALHWACWKGHADLVEMLLQQGASLTIKDKSFDATPPGWFSHGLQNSGESGGDYPQVARLLLAAGAQIAESDIPSGHDAVVAVFREQGLLG